MFLVNTTFGQFRNKVAPKNCTSGNTVIWLFIGFGKGDVLCMFCSNYVEYWLIALAAWSCGGCVMPVNCELEPGHLENQLKTTKAKVRNLTRAY